MNINIFKAFFLLTGFASATWWGTPAYAHDNMYQLTLTCTSCGNSGTGMFTIDRFPDSDEMGCINVLTESISVTYPSGGGSVAYTHNSGSPQLCFTDGAISGVPAVTLTDGSSATMTLADSGSGDATGEYSVTGGLQNGESGTYVVFAVPEPGTLSMFALGLAALGLRARKSRRNSTKPLQR